MPNVWSFRRNVRIGKTGTRREHRGRNHSRLFKKTTGFAPSQYLIRLRMAHARRLLRETTKSMIDIGLEVGYSSPRHFAQMFRRAVGVTPSEYRHQI
jgi:AraC-like DNA-binding protein